MLLGGLLCCLYSKAQIVNFVNNGGFEDLMDCNNLVNNNKTKFWSSIDTNKFSYQISNVCLGNVPAYGYNFQRPHTGNGYVIGTFLCSGCNPTHNRSYVRNKLKYNLTANRIYCVKFYVNIKDESPYGSDGVGIYFADSNLDTIKYGDIIITYLTPQIQNSNNNIITDTMNWVPVSGTFTATGSEKYLVIGNFKSDVNTNKTYINPTFSGIWTDFCIDDVSCIDLDLPAFAGRDTFFIPGDSIYLGRPSDVGIDEDCMWYKLPNTTTAIDTVAGLWVKPVTTTTYVVKQDICGNIKWDTVVLYQSAIGVHELDLISNNLKIYPQPATNVVNIQLNLQMDAPFNKYQLYNNLGQLIREEELSFKNHIASIRVEDLANGVYFISISNLQNETITKKLVITK